MHFCQVTRLAVALHTFHIERLYNDIIKDVEFTPQATSELLVESLIQRSIAYLQQESQYERHRRDVKEGMKTFASKNEKKRKTHLVLSGS